MLYPSKSGKYPNRYGQRQLKPLDYRQKNLKVVAFPQGDPEEDNHIVPSIRVAGKWLKSFGFEIDDEVVLEATDRQIVIRKATR